MGWYRCLKKAGNPAKRGVGPGCAVRFDWGNLTWQKCYSAFGRDFRKSGPPEAAVAAGRRGYKSSREFLAIWGNDAGRSPFVAKKTVPDFLRPGVSFKLIGKRSG